MRRQLFSVVRLVSIPLKSGRCCKTVTIDKAAATVKFETGGANLMFWGNEFVHYAVTDDGLDPDEPVIVPRSAGGFLEPIIAQ